MCCLVNLLRQLNNIALLIAVIIIIIISSYQQALSSVEVGLKKLEEFGVPTKRPDDYFAEMLKTDDHMRKASSCTFFIVVCCSQWEL